ncbi:MAG: hypothetical protein RL141_916 [Candidatus Parcubacteria bacterium]|jgi:SAM-dependent methyltransferase
MTRRASSIRSADIAAINEATNERYDRRLQEKGPGAYALGWGKEQFQVKRFHHLLHAVGSDFFRGKKVADIGCGLGDLYPFLKKQQAAPRAYVGTDVNAEFVRLATQTFRRDRRATFQTRDVMLRPLGRGVAQTGVALGVINFKQKNHEAYAKRFIQACYASVSDAVAINVISAIRNMAYAPESVIYYYDPAKWLAWAQAHVTPFCSVIHDYAGEPQHEFFLLLRKHPWKH